MNATNISDAQVDREMMRRAWLFGWFIRIGFDRDGYWLIDRLGYRNTFLVSWTRVSDEKKQNAYRIIFLWFRLEWARPKK